MKIADDTFRTYWLQPVIDYLLRKSGMAVEGVDLTGQAFFFQIAGPRSVEILEKGSQSDLHDIFVYHADKVMAGDRQIGMSSSRLNSNYYRRLISLGFIDKEFAAEGQELSVV